MAAQASWVGEAPAVNDSVSVVIDTVLTTIGLDSDELSGSGLPRIVGNSDALRQVLGMVRIVAPTDATVLINGETGTGKELIAEAIHKCSNRNGPFVKVNCAAIPAGLLESEMFGHERGAYTGAVARGIGRFERANRGTLFLDEIGDLPLELQPKLLRVMQERQFERLGGAATIHTDVRVICATHRNLIKMVDEHQFRADLFYRLSVFPIELPPLRNRREDIRLLVHHFAMDYAARMRKPIVAIADQFMAALALHSWPGNVRELQNLIERSVILSKGPVLNGSLPELTYTRLSAPVTMEEAERSHVLQTLQQTGGVLGGPNGAAARLGLPRTTLIAKMKRLRINRGQSSRLPARATASVPSSRQTLRIPPPIQDQQRLQAGLQAHGRTGEGNNAISID
jgi:formate hydrogenlyase transcriptional activator